MHGFSSRCAVNYADLDVDDAPAVDPRPHLHLPSGRVGPAEQRACGPEVAAEWGEHGALQVPLEAGGLYLPECRDLGHNGWLSVAIMSATGHVAAAMPGANKRSSLGVAIAARIAVCAASTGSDDRSGRSKSNLE